MLIEPTKSQEPHFFVYENGEVLGELIKSLETIFSSCFLIWHLGSTKDGGLKKCL